MKNLVSVDWLANRLDDKSIIILDCSVEVVSDDEGNLSYLSGRSLYEGGHIPGACHADLITELSDPDTPMLCALPSADAFKTVIAKLGVGDDTSVVLYDRSFTAWASRVWWMLRWVGFDNAMILDGGYGAWTEAGHNVLPGAQHYRPSVLTTSPRPNMIAQQSDVRAAVSDASTQLTDTLGPDSFSGATCNYNRPGHIKGAKNAFALDLFDDKGLFKSPKALAELLGGTTATRHITYCGAGILASATAFVLVQLGHDTVSVYMASLQEWAVDPANPMATTT